MRPLGFIALGLIGLIGVGGGCSKGKKEKKEVYPVHGKVLYNGKPMDKGLLFFLPADNPSIKSVHAQGWTDEKGNFKLSTYNTNDGAPEGKYVVTIYWPEGETKAKAAAPGSGSGPGLPQDEAEMAPDRLKWAYNDPAKTTLKAVVEAKDNEINFTLP